MKAPHSTGKLFPLLCIVLFFVFIFLANHLPFFSTWDTKFLGFRMKIRDTLFPPPKNSDIVLVVIDEASKGLYGRFPWPRNVYAKLINAISDEKKDISPKAITFDVMFGGKEEHDSELAKAIRRAGNVVLAVGYDPSEESGGKVVFRPLSPVIMAVNPHCGSIVTPTDIDKKITALPVMVGGVFADKKDTPTSLNALEISTLSVSQRSGKNKGSEENTQPVLTKKALIVGDITIPLYQGARPGDRTFLRNPHFLINYRGSPGKTFESHSFQDVCEGKVTPEAFRDKIVFVINTIDPNDRFYSTKGETIFGGEMHAFALRTILDRDFITVSSRWVNFLIYILISLSTALIFWKVKNRRTAVFLGIGIAFMFTLACILLFCLTSVWLPYTIPVTGSIFFAIFYVYLENLTFGKTLRALLPKSFISRMDAVDGKPEAGGEARHVTVLFADIRGYTNLSEKLSSKEVLDMLNEYHSLVKKPIHENGGEIFDFQGDAYMVVFGADRAQKDHAIRAIKAAIGIARLVEVLKKKWTSEGKSTFEIGIGICTGEVALGFVGHDSGDDKRLQPAAIGDTTNVSARLQGKSSEFKTPILMTETTMRELSNVIPTVELQPVELKGKSEKLLIYTVDWEKLKE